MESLNGKYANETSDAAGSLTCDRQRDTVGKGGITGPWFIQAAQVRQVATTNIVFFLSNILDL